MEAWGRGTDGQADAALEGAPFGTRLRAYRLAAGLSQDELAERAGLSRRGIVDLERGARRAPYPGTVRRLAEALKLSEPQRLALVRTARADPGAGAAAGSRPSHNLPGQLSTFIGRERELSELRDRLTISRLLTLSGPGGIGKTRLALRLAAELHEQYAAGCWLADLAPLADGSLLPHTLATSLGLTEEPVRSVLEVVVEHLKRRAALVVLDNCEHLRSACAQLVVMLLQTCPGVTILATSREPLHVPGECIWLVPPLGVPDRADEMELEALQRTEAIQLFTERAVAAGRQFVLTRSNAAAVAEICQRLDGIPLAIELAAARTRLLTAEEIAGHLDHRFELLTEPVGFARQHTLRALCEWSHNLLDSPEQLVFRRLAVFAGGWTLEAAEAVCGDSALDHHEILDLVCRLVDKSMIQAQPRGDRTRYMLLETLRQFGTERLVQAGEESTVRDRHLLWYVQLAEDVESKLRGPGASLGLDRLAAEHDNLRAALRWSSRRAALIETGLRLAGALGWYWWVRGHPVEGRAWLEELLACAESMGHAPSGVELAVARAQAALALLHLRRNDSRAARPLIERTIGFARSAANVPLEALSLLYLGQTEFMDGHLERAQAHLEAGLRLAEQGTGLPRPYQFLSWLGQVADAANRLEAAEAHLERQLELAREQADIFFEDTALLHLGELALRRGDLGLARARLEDALVRHAEVAPGGVPGILGGLAEVALREGHFARGLRLAGATQGLIDTRGFAMDRWRWERIGPHMETARQALSQVVANVVLEQGRAMTLEQARAYALAAEVAGLDDVADERLEAVASTEPSESGAFSR